MNLAQFCSWALSERSVAKYDDGQYLGECVSLVNQYCWRVLSIPAGAWGHAKDWATNDEVEKYFDQVTEAVAGDVLVYGSEYGGGYGHIEVALGGGLALFQNRNGTRRVGTGAAIPRPRAILRRKGSSMDQQEQISKLWLALDAANQDKDRLWSALDQTNKNVDVIKLAAEKLAAGTNTKIDLEDYELRLVKKEGGKQ